MREVAIAEVWRERLGRVVGRQVGGIYGSCNLIIRWVGWDVMGWARLGCHEMGWDGMGWDGMGLGLGLDWDGMR